MRNVKYLLPLLFFLACASMASEWDLASSAAFFNEETGMFWKPLWAKHVYHWGIWPALLVGFGALAVFLIGFLKPRYVRWRRVALSLALTLALGSGLISNGLLKEYWKRPRPVQTQRFQGKEPFRPFYEPNFFHKGGPLRSFPSGHSTMGFYFFSFYFLGKRFRYALLRYGGLFVALLLGGLLGFTRIVQGGHYLSDVMAAAVIMWMTAWFVDWLVWRKKKEAFL